MRRRHAFTIVELLVSMALIILIMSVLSQAFVAATASVRDLKALGDMANRLRNARATIGSDLAADHFVGRKKLSDPAFWLNGPPPEGFFRIWQGSQATATGPNNWIEGVDLDNINSYRSTDHMLHFTVKLRGNLRSDFMSASVPAGSPLLSSAGLGIGDRRYQDSGAYNSQWAEVEYFLRPVVDATGNNQDTAGVTPLFALYRRQQLAVPDNSLVTSLASTTANLVQHLEVSTSAQPDTVGTSSNIHFNSPLDLTMPVRRFGTLATSYAGVPSFTDTIVGRLTYPTMGETVASASPPQTGYEAADLLLSDVLSFDVRILLFGGTDFVELFDPSVQAFNNAAGPNPNYYSTITPKLPAVFDTWSSVTDDTYIYGFDSSLGVGTPPPGAVAWMYPGDPRTIPLYQNQTNGQTIRIKAIQITIRVWDFKTKQARQITIVQDL